MFVRSDRQDEIVGCELLAAILPRSLTADGRTRRLQLIAIVPEAGWVGLEIFLREGEHYA